MILKKQKTFNSQAQKMRRAVYDMKYGLDSIENNPSHLFTPKDMTNSEQLKRAGRINRIKDTSEIGQRGIAEKKGVLNAHNRFNTFLNKAELEKEKVAAKAGDALGIKVPVEKGNYIRRAARSLVDKEAKAKAENAIKAEAKFATKKAEILAKRAKLANLKKAGKIGLGVGVAAGLGYGGYKAYQHFKNKDKKD